MYKPNSRLEITEAVLASKDYDLMHAWARVYEFLDELAAEKDLTEDPNEGDNGSHQDQAPEDFTTTDLPF